MLVPNESGALEPGMVVCLEPVVDGFWHLQDELLITEGRVRVHLPTGSIRMTLFVMG